MLGAFTLHQIKHSLGAVEPSKPWNIRRQPKSYRGLPPEPCRLWGGAPGRSVSGTQPPCVAPQPPPPAIVYSDPWLMNCGFIGTRQQLASEHPVGPFSGGPSRIISRGPFFQPPLIRGLETTRSRRGRRGRAPPNVRSIMHKCYGSGGRQVDGVTGFGPNVRPGVPWSRHRDRGA